jgi:hypothetical protein
MISKRTARKKRNKTNHAENGNTTGLTRRQAAGLNAMLLAMQAKQAVTNRRVKAAAATGAALAGGSLAYKTTTRPKGRKKKVQSDNNGTRESSSVVKPTRRDNRLTVSHKQRSVAKKIVRDAMLTKMGDAIVSGDGSLKIQAYKINPADAAQEWVYEEARANTFYRLNRGRWYYDTIEADTERGEIAVGLQYNLRAPPPTTMDDVMKLPSAKRSQIASNFYLDVDTKLFHSSRPWLRTSHEYEPKITDYHGCIVWVATENFKTGVADGYKVGNWSFKATWEFKDNSTPGNTGTASPGDEIRMTQGTCGGVSPNGIAPITSWQSNYNEIEGYTDDGTGVTAGFDAYVWIKCSVPVTQSTAGVGSTSVAGLHLIINDVIVATNYETLCATSNFTGSTISNVTLRWYGLVRAGDLIRLDLGNLSTSNSAVSATPVTKTAYFTVRLRGISVGATGLFEAAAAPPDQKASAGVPPAPTDSRVAPSGDEYRDKVMRLRKLQAELDAIDEAESELAPKTGMSLNC